MEQTSKVFTTSWSSTGVVYSYLNSYVFDYRMLSFGIITASAHYNSIKEGKINLILIDYQFASQAYNIHLYLEWPC